MGEARLSLTALFVDGLAAQAAATQLSALIAEGAEDWWQEHRNEAPETFWPAFKARHPLTCQVLVHATYHDGKTCRHVRILPDGENGDCDNGLAGVLDFADNVFDDEEPRELSRPVVKGRRLTYWAVTWYWAIWEPLAQWLLDLGAKEVRWETPQGKFGIGRKCRQIKRCA